MRSPRILSGVILVAGLVGAAGSAHHLVTGARLRVQANPANTRADFTAFLDTVDAAQRELQNGRPEAFKALWARADDVTLSGGFGGAIEKGWDARPEHGG